MKYMIILVALILIISVFYYISSLFHFNFDELTKNLYSGSEISLYAGILQKAGLTLWIATAAICLFVVYVKYDKHKFFLFAGYISAFFALDELLLLHNKLLPSVYKLNQNFIYIVYGVVLIIFLLKHKERILRSEFIFLYTSLFFLGIKIFIDGLQNMGIIGEASDSFVEDSAKLIGIYFWFYYFTRFAFFKIRDRNRIIEGSHNGNGKPEVEGEVKKEMGG